MFEIKEGMDKFGRQYKYVSGDDESVEPRKVNLIFPVYNDEYYLEYCLKSFHDQVDGIYVVDNMSTDGTRRILKDYNVTVRRSSEKNFAKLRQINLNMVPKNSWIFMTDSDDVLYDLPKRYVGRYVSFLHNNNIFCSDIRFFEICYNYGTIMAMEYGDGPGILWTARRLFYYTGKEWYDGDERGFHENIRNATKTEPNNEHTDWWNGTVAKTHEIMFFHYGKCAGIEKWRRKEGRVLSGEMGAMGYVPTMPFGGRHPSVMKLG